MKTVHKEEQLVNCFLGEAPWCFKTSKHQHVLKHLDSFKLQYLLSFCHPFPKEGPPLEIQGVKCCN